MVDDAQHSEIPDVSWFAKDKAPYPVIHPNPPLYMIHRNMNTYELQQIALFTVVGFPLGFLVGTCSSIVCEFEMSLTRTLGAPMRRANMFGMAIMTSLAGYLGSAAQSYARLIGTNENSADII